MITNQVIIQNSCSHVENITAFWELFSIFFLAINNHIYIFIWSIIIQINGWNLLNQNLIFRDFFCC